MKQDNFNLEILIARQPKDILALLSNFKYHTEIHPLIISVRESDAPTGVIRRYYIRDMLPLGPFHFKIEYRADILRLTDEEIYTEAYQTPQTTVYNLTRVTPTAEGGSHLQESVTIKAPNLLFGYAFAQAKNAHTDMLQRIKRFMEDETQSS